MVKKLQGFKIKKFLRQALVTLVQQYSSLDSALNKDGNHYPHLFPEECKYIKKKVIKHIIYDLESFSDDSYDSDEEQINVF